MRGFATEATLLIGWVLAFAVGLIFCQGLSLHLRSLVASVPIRMGLSFVFLFFLTLIVARLLRSLLRQWLAASGAGSGRLTGMIFGSARGLLMITILVVLAGITNVPDTAWWRKSELIPPFQSVALWLKGQIRSGIAAQLAY